MAFDKLYYFDKTPTYISGLGNKYTRHEYGEVQNNFNMSFVADETKDSCKVIVYNNDSKELDPLTICWLESTNTWWVVKSDKVTRYANEIGAYYRHDLSLYGAFEILNARDLTNCGFNAHRYTLRQFLTRLERMMDFEFPITWDFGTYASLDQEITYLKTFQNYTPASAIREMFRGMNLTPKLTFTTNGGVGIQYITGAKITAYSKSGSVMPSIDINQFDNEEEQCSSDIESFGTRVISNVQNCVSADPIRYPAVGSTKLVSNEPTVSGENGFLRLPSSIYKVNKIIIGRMLLLTVGDGVSAHTKSILVNPMSFNKDSLLDFIKSSFTNYGTETFWENFEANYTSFQASLFSQSVVELKNGGKYNKIDDTYSGDYLTITGDVTTEHGTEFEIILNDKAHGTTAIYNQKWAMYWEQGNDKIENFKWLEQKGREFPTQTSPTTQIAYYDNDGWYISANTDVSSMQSYSDEYLDINNVVFAVEYVPMADLKVKVDNNKEQNDSNLYNQNGKMVDSVAISKLINSHAKEISSNEITKYKTYRNYADIPTITQLVDNEGEKYIINNISINFFENDDDHYFMQCQFTMTKQVACKSTMISANTNIRDYDCPQQNNVPRIQVYRDYIELDYEEEHNETPYLALEQVLSFGATIKGLVDNHTCVFSATDSEDNTYYYQIGTSKFNLNKQFVEVADFKDNNIIGYEAGKSYWTGSIQQFKDILNDGVKRVVNTPISYVDDIGELSSLELLYLDTNQLESAYEENDATDIIGKFVTVPTEIWNYLTNDSSRYDINISEPNYDKDGLEVPVFEYACQVGDNNDIIFGADFLKGESAVLIKYKISTPSNVYVTQENANNYFSGSDATLTYSNGTLTIAESNGSSDFYGKSVVAYCEIYNATTSIRKYDGIYDNSVGVSTNDGAQTIQLPSHGDLNAYILQNANTYQLDNPYNCTCSIVSYTEGANSFVYTISMGEGGELEYISVTLNYTTKKETLITETHYTSQQISVEATPSYGTTNLSEDNVTYQTLQRNVPYEVSKQHIETGSIFCGVKSGSYYRSQYTNLNIPELASWNGSTITLENLTNPSISQETPTVQGTLLTFRLRNDTQTFCNYRITFYYTESGTVTIYTYGRNYNSITPVSYANISQNDLATKYGLSGTGYSNSATIVNGTIVSMIVHSDTPTMSYTASCYRVTGYSGSYDVPADYQQGISNVSISGDSSNTVEVYLKSLQAGYYFRGNVYSQTLNPITCNISYNYTTTYTQVDYIDHSVETTEFSGRNITYNIPVAEGTLYGTPTISFTNALSDPYITIQSFDTSTGEVTYVAGDNDYPNEKVGVRIKYVEWYRNYGLDKKEFLFAVNKCKVHTNGSLELKVNNWKLK